MHLEYPVRSTGVDRLGAVGQPRTGNHGGIQHGGQVLDRTLTVADVVRSDGQTVVIEVRTARHFPDRRKLRGLPKKVRSVRLLLNTSVSVSNSRTGTPRSLRIVVGVGAAQRWPRRLGQCRSCAELAVYQEAVVDVCDRLYGVDVGHHASGRLRLTGRNQLAGGQATEDLRRIVVDRSAGLGVDVVGEAVTRDRERGIFRWIGGRRRSGHRLSGRRRPPRQSPLGSAHCGSASNPGRRPVRH